MDPTTNPTGFWSEDGLPISQEEWAVMREHREGLDLKTYIGCTLVSTVWVGLEVGGPTPLIFETLIADPSQGENIVRRYPTRQEAVEGHWEAVELAKHVNVLRGGEWISPWDTEWTRAM